MQQINEDLNNSERYNLNHNSMNFQNERQHHHYRRYNFERKLDDKTNNRYSNRSIMEDISIDNEKLPPLNNYNTKIYY